MSLPVKFKYIFFICISYLTLHVFCVSADSWQEVSDKHFIVQYYSVNDSSWALEVLRLSESYYRKIAYQIGYNRYKDFWTWDERVIIKVYPTQESFIKATGQPPWAKGAARRDNSLVHSRSIVTYKQEDGFMDGILPHEIGHLIFRDFIGFQTDIPLWFDEGVAQLQQKGIKQDVNRVVKKFVKAGMHIPFDQFQRADVRFEADPFKVTLFYGQSYSVVDFLLTKYGTHAFSRMCQELREGESFDNALKTAYGIYFSSMQEFEKKWLNYIQN